MRRKSPKRDHCMSCAPVTKDLRAARDAHTDSEWKEAEIASTGPREKSWESLSMLHELES